MKEIADWLDGVEKLLTDNSICYQGTPGFHGWQKPDGKEDFGVFGKTNIIAAEKDIVTL